MYSLKGFINIKSLINNIPGATSPIGEMTTWAYSFSRDIGEYENILCPDVRLTTLSSNDSIAGKVMVDKSVADHILVVVDWLINRYKAANLPISVNNVSAVLMANFSGLIADLSMGPIVSYENVNVPEWISWRRLANPSNTLKVWFSHASLLEQYDEYDIVVIPPVVNIDDFFLPTSTVSSLVYGRSVSAMIDQVQVAKGKNPETYLRTSSYDFKNINFSNNSVTTSWPVLIYGPRGDNLDAIKQAIISYILGNTARTISEWIAIFPTLFQRTEFVIIPRWDKYAIPNKTIQAGIYSPIVNADEAATFAMTMLDNGTPAYVKSCLTIIPHHFKSVALLCVGSQSNVGNKNIITDYFPDFINVGTNSVDFNRMSPTTQDWAIVLEQLLIAAEVAGVNTPSPTAFRKIYRTITRNGVATQGLFISTVFNDVQYLVSAKINY